MGRPEPVAGGFVREHLGPRRQSSQSQHLQRSAITSTAARFSVQADTAAQPGPALRRPGRCASFEWSGATRWQRAHSGCGVAARFAVSRHKNTVSIPCRIRRRTIGSRGSESGGARQPGPGRRVGGPRTRAGGVPLPEWGRRPSARSSAILARFSGLVGGIVQGKRYGIAGETGGGVDAPAD